MRGVEPNPVSGISWPPDPHCGKGTVKHVESAVLFCTDTRLWVSPGYIDDCCDDDNDDSNDDDDDDKDDDDSERRS